MFCYRVIILRYISHRPPEQVPAGYCIVCQDNENFLQTDTLNEITYHIATRLSCSSESRSMDTTRCHNSYTEGIEADSVIKVIDIILTHSLCVYLKQKVNIPHL